MRTDLGVNAMVRSANAAMKGMPTMLPDGDVHYSTVGTALDYRLRYYFAVTPVENLVAHHRLTLMRRAVTIGGDAGPSEYDSEEFFGSLRWLVERLDPVGRQLSGDDEASLCRYCYALALFEQVYRSGMSVWDTPGFTWPAIDDPVERLLALAPDAAVRDLSSLSRLFWDKSQPMLRVAQAKGVRCNPTFSGSMILRADADLIIGSMIADIKTSIHPRIDRTQVLQIIGYTLLDTHDEYGIDMVGFYLSRIGHWVAWPLQELLDFTCNHAMVIGQSGGRRSSIPVSEWREMFMAMLLAE